MVSDLDTPLADPLPLNQPRAALPIALSLVALGVFAWLPFSYYRMMGWPWILIWQGAFLTVGGWLVWRVRRFDQPFYPLGHGLDWLLGLTLAGLIAAALGAPFRPLAAWNVVLFMCYGGVIYALRHLPQPPQALIRGLWRGIVGVAIGSAIVSLAYWKPPAAGAEGDAFQSALRNLQPLGHHNFVGGYFALVIPLGVALTLTEKPPMRWLYGVGTVLMLGALYLSGSRGGYLGFLAWLLVTLALRVGRSRGRQRQRLGIASLGIAALGVVGLLSNARVRQSITGLLGATAGGEPLSVSDGPLVDRYFMARAGFNLLKDHPWLGVGSGNLSRVYNLYRPLEAGAGLDHIQQLHNTPIHLMGELGLLGIALYVGWLWVIGRLGWRLFRSLADNSGAEVGTEADRALLFGLGGAALAYGVSSLMDYQLENIPITGTLLVGLALLVLLMERRSPPPPSLPQFSRRILSLVMLLVIALWLRLWMPFDVSLALENQAFKAVQRDDVAAAHTQWLKAAAIAPWDPTADALAAQLLVTLEDLTESPEGKRTLQKGVLEHLRAAQKAAPNDVWFNHNLAVRLLLEDPAEAEIFASRTVELLPRNRNYTYYMLALTYLAQEKLEPAFSALALEGLVNPDFTTFPLWRTDPFASVYDQVVEASLALYDGLMAEVTPTGSAYPVLYEYSQFLRWWHQRPLLPIQPELLRPLTQAALVADGDPDAALEILNTAIATDENDLALQLLRAWLKPEDYLEDFLTFPVEEPFQAALASARENILQYRDLRGWLTSLVDPGGTRKRQGLAFAYRNREANRIELILRPYNLQIHSLVFIMGFLEDWPREFPEMDRLIQGIKVADLGLSHPTVNGFQLTRATPEPPADPEPDNESGSE